MIESSDVRSTVCSLTVSYGHLHNVPDSFMKPRTEDQNHQRDQGYGNISDTASIPYNLPLKELSFHIMYSALHA